MCYCHRMLTHIRLVAFADEVMEDPLGMQDGVYRMLTFYLTTPYSMAIE